MMIPPPFVVLFLLVCTCTSQLIEQERLKEYHSRNYTWPPKEIVPDTEGWRKLMERRMEQVQQIPDTSGRYIAWQQTVAAAYVKQNFTENGWGLTRAPEELTKVLRTAIHDGLPTAGLEKEVPIIEGQRPLLIRRPDLEKRVLKELKPMHEAWSGIELVPYQAYGFRLYRNQSSINMHVDRAQTHVIASIFHIGSSDDADPWPIIIEDLHGNTNEVVLKPGDMLFYEASKCFHGRPTKFNGSWYSSVFTFYYPVGNWSDTDWSLEVHYGVPPIWKVPPPGGSNLPDELVMVGGSMKEPGCPGNWCNLANSIKLEGPAKKDYIITRGGKSYPLYTSPENEL